VNHPSSVQNKNAYVVSTPLYEGPLDILLQLIEHAELDITKFALAQVTDQYLAYMHDLPEGATDQVSEFLVIAAKLIQIKSEALLPRPPIRDLEVEDPGDTLARQLIIYKRYKDLAAMLGQRESSNLHTFVRIAPVPKFESVIDLGELSLDILVGAAYDVFLAQDKAPLGTVVAPPIITIREKIHHISVFLRKFGSGTFRQLLSQKTVRLDVVVTFLAMLELVKRHLVSATQESIFGDIQLEANSEWDESEVLEIEFGE